MPRLFRKGRQSSQSPQRQSQQQSYPQQRQRLSSAATGGKQRPDAKNPQSGASYSNSSSSRASGGTLSDDGAAVPINLTDQRLNDWTNDGPANNTSTVRGASTDGKNVSFPNTQLHPQKRTTSSRPPSSGVTNLILLIEQSKWTEASLRAQTHPHEVKQLVKLRKTTKSSGGSSAGGVQISNVKCKALHHACQKLRSVHTNIYSNRGGETTSEKKVEGGHIIDQDEYIEACKCILKLIQLHPEACKERESRHGCLPLHLAVFSMCLTPPPPGPNGRHQHHGPTIEQSMNDKVHSRISSDSTYNQSASKPPPIAARSSSAGHAVRTPPIPQSTKGHRPTNSNDFSVGNISTMIQEENEVQQALDQHQQSTKADVDDQVNDDTLEGKLLSRMNDMETILKDLENEYNSKHKKNQRGNSGGVSPSAVGMDSDSPGGAWPVEGATAATTTKVVGVSMPMDSLDEISRETDSHSSPLEEYRQPNNVEQKLPPAEEKTAEYASTEFMKQVGSIGKSISNKITSPKSSTQSSNATVASHSSAASEEWKRRYLQINSARREEYSTAVINALLDAWPRGVKTSSEGK